MTDEKDNALERLGEALHGLSAPSSDCPSCGGLNISCPHGCGRDPRTGELDGSTLTPSSGGSGESCTCFAREPDECACGAWDDDDRPASTPAGEGLVEQAVQAALDAGLAVNGEHGVAAARHAARFVAAARQSDAAEIARLREALGGYACLDDLLANLDFSGFRDCLIAAAVIRVQRAALGDPR